MYRVLQRPDSRAERKQHQNRTSTHSEGEWEEVQHEVEEEGINNDDAREKQH